MFLHSPTQRSVVHVEVATPWQDAYRAQLDDASKEPTTEELAVSCLALENISDEELAEFAVTVALAEDASDIDGLLEREGVEPTEEIYDEAAGIFFDVVKNRASLDRIEPTPLPAKWDGGGWSV